MTHHSLRYKGELGVMNAKPDCFWLDSVYIQKGDMTALIDDIIVNAFVT